ncbi:MAG TPA: hypothetical protein VIJ48_08325 [Acidimicrobiia bacterium]
MENDRIVGLGVGPPANPACAQASGAPSFDGAPASWLSHIFV